MPASEERGSAERLSDFEAQRPRLLRLGYGMLGSVSDAEDVVQDAWLRWARVEDGVDSRSAYLTRTVTRLCLDRMKSARARRETYVGCWLPEPLVGSTNPDEIVADDVTMTLMLALERLSPLERAAFLLHDVFDVDLVEVAAILERRTDRQYLYDAQSGQAAPCRGGIRRIMGPRSVRRTDN